MAESPQPFELDERFEVETPEHIAIEYDLAGLGSRFVALLLDTLIQLLASMVLFLLLWLAVSAFAAETPEDEGMLAAIAVIGILLINLGYYLFFETLWSGQTPGKRAVGIRVVRDQGTPISFLDAAIRNLVRLVDMLPFYSFGLVCAFISRKRKRLGDYAAGTIVVRERSAPLPGTPRPPPHALAPEWEQFVTPCEARLTDGEAAAISRFLARRAELEPEARSVLGSRLVGALADRLPPGATRGNWQQNEALLEALHRLRARRREMPLRER